MCSYTPYLCNWKNSFRDLQTTNFLILLRYFHYLFITISCKKKRVNHYIGAEKFYFFSYFDIPQRTNSGEFIHSISCGVRN